MVSYSGIESPVFFRVISIHNERAAVYAIYSGEAVNGRKLEAWSGYIIRFKKEKAEWVYDDYSFPPY